CNRVECAIAVRLKPVADPPTRRSNLGAGGHKTNETISRAGTTCIDAVVKDRDAVRTPGGPRRCGHPKRIRWERSGGSDLNLRLVHVVKATTRGRRSSELYAEVVEAGDAHAIQVAVHTRHRDATWWEGGSTVAAELEILQRDACYGSRRRAHG